MSIVAERGEEGFRESISRWLRGEVILENSHRDHTESVYMLHVALFEPEIPSNTGNIIRLCANTGARLHLIHPLGFFLDDRKLRRAGLDYHEWASVREHLSFAAFLETVPAARLFAFTTRASRAFHEVAYQDGDVLLFGPETRGLPRAVLERLPPAQRLRIPMVTSERSLNLANAVAIAVYEAWRQRGFDGAETRPHALAERLHEVE